MRVSDPLLMITLQLKMSKDLKLYEHFKEHLDSIDEDGTCYVISEDYEPFVGFFMNDMFGDGFDAHVTGLGDLSFHIDKLKPYFDDFETFKRIIMKDFENKDQDFKENEENFSNSPQR